MPSDPLLRSDVMDVLRKTFPEQPLDPLLEILGQYQWGEHPRVLTAAIYLSKGDPQRLKDMIDAANTDYRDVLYWYSLDLGANEDWRS